MTDCLMVTPSVTIILFEHIVVTKKILTGSSDTLFPSILNSSIFVQFANDAGTADSWLYL